MVRQAIAAQAGLTQSVAVSYTNGCSDVHVTHSSGAV